MFARVLKKIYELYEKFKKRNSVCKTEKHKNYSWACDEKTKSFLREQEWEEKGGRRMGKCGWIKDYKRIFLCKKCNWERECFLKNK